MLGAKARRVHHAGWMVSFGTEGVGYIIRNVHTVSTLVVQNHAVSSCGHTAVDAEGCGNISCYITVVAVNA